MNKLVFLAGVLGTILFVTASILGGAQIEGYSIISQYISESYATGLPNTKYLRVIYIVSGILIALFGFLAPSFLPKSKGIKIGFWLFAIFYGFGTVVTGLFPCDIGCNPDPEVASLSQFIHNTTGFFTYVFVPFCILAIGFSIKRTLGKTKFSMVSIFCGILAFALVVLLFGNPTGSYIGLFQRLIEGSILFWILFAAYTIMAKNTKVI